MNLKGFLVDALGTALELGIATADDVIKYVTPDLLSTHLPRPLWARLLTACLGAPKVDAQLVVETIGVPNLCEHIPSNVIWACIGEVAQRSLGQDITFKPPAAVAAPLTGTASRPNAAPLTMAAPPPAEVRTSATPPPPPPGGPSIPSPALADVVAALESDERAAPSPSGRARTPTGQRFRQSNTGIGRLAANNTRRPQAAAAAPPEAPRPIPSVTTARRGSTEADYDVETEVGKDDWKNALAVEDEQLVDWSAAEETVTHTADRDDYGRKR